MKRTLALLAASALVALPTVSEAAPKAKPKPKPTKRVVSWNYEGFHGLTTPAVYTAFVTPCQIETACYELSTLKHEKSVTIDAGKQIAIQYFLDGDYNTVETLCGKGTVPVSKGTTVNLVIVLDATCPGPPTNGTVSLTVTGIK